MRQRGLECFVGLFFILSLMALAWVAFNASQLSGQHTEHAIKITADFDDVAGLRVRAPVKIAGVKVGEVGSISLKHYRAHLVMHLNHAVGLHIPIDSEARILTEGLLGSKYISIVPGMSDEWIQAGGMIERTTAVMVLERLIGKVVSGFGK
ncbi:MAG: outer membrane lipid asymmetry maintenance protein MlaD [Legionellales bacterium]|nr:outer membrane lipid asymmetry maintenance protein MlaD [Legionellales bacterium]